MDKISLSNIDCYVSFDKRFKTSSINLFFISPFENKLLPEKSLLTRILTSCTKTYPKEEDFNYLLEDAYDMYVDAYSFVIGKTYITRFSVSFIRDEFITEENIDMFDTASKVINDIIFNPCFKKARLEKEKQLTINEIKAKRSHSSSYAINEFFKIMFKNEIPSIDLNGTIEDIEKVTINSLKEAYLSIISSECVMYVSGNLSNLNIKSLNNMNLGNLTKYDPTTKQFIDLDKKIINEVAKVEEVKDASQSVLCMGYRILDYDNEKTKHQNIMLSDMLGGYFHSSLIKEIREKMSMAYNISTDISISKGYMNIYAGISSSNYQIVVDIILEIIDNYKHGLIDDEVLSLTKKAKINDIKKKGDSSQSNFARFMSVLMNKKYLEDNEVIKLYDNITKEQIAKASNSLVLDTIYLLKGEKND